MADTEVTHEVSPQDTAVDPVLAGSPILNQPINVPVLNPIGGTAPTAVAPADGSPVTLTPNDPTFTPSPPTTSSVSVIVPNTTGTITFSLVVTDNLGVQSQPAFATVTVQGAPVAVLTATPSPVSEGGAIELSGAGSTSTGSIASYVFSLVPPTAVTPPVT